jgi:hypothetical protein
MFPNQYACLDSDQHFEITMTSCFGSGWVFDRETPMSRPPVSVAVIADLFTNAGATVFE